MLTVQGVHAFEDNYIWLIRQTGRPHVAIVDPGDAAPVIAAMNSEGLQPVAILITHHHWDHTGGISDLLNQYSIPVYGPAKESIPHRTQALTEGNVVHIPELDSQFQVLDVPGHTKGHIAYYHPSEDGEAMLFCGDTLFAGGCGRLFEGTAEQMHQSLSKILALPDNTQVYCAHEYTEANLVFARIAEPDNQALIERQGDVRRLRQMGKPTVPSLLGLEKATNPFLRCHQASIVKAAENFAGRSLPEPAMVFGTVRHWKDTLD
jgi:hydroxyacylglutathione hydrolase